MAQWAKIKFFWDNMLGGDDATLAATSTDSTGDYSVDHLHDMLEWTRWKAVDATTPCRITLDTGAKGRKTMADYLVIYGHNLGSVNASVVLQCSDDGVTYANAFSPVMLTSNNVFLKEFDNPGSRRWWRLEITGHNGAPELTLCIWGQKTELDYVTAGFDPHEEETKANVSVSETGYLLGIHRRYVERAMSLKMEDSLSFSPPRLADGSVIADGNATATGAVEITVYEKARRWQEASGLNNFFVAWESANRPDEVFLMRPDARWSNPFKAGGIYRDITINLKGRKAA